MGNTKEGWEKMEVIHSYSRTQALEDGVLVDISPLAKEAGFKFLCCQFPSVDFARRESLTAKSHSVQPAT
jgi:hypothetical protein